MKTRSIINVVYTTKQLEIKAWESLPNSVTSRKLIVFTVAQKGHRFLIKI